MDWSPWGINTVNWPRWLREFQTAKLLDFHTKDLQRIDTNLKVFCMTWRKSWFHSGASFPVVMMKMTAKCRIGEKVTVACRAARGTGWTSAVCPAESAPGWAAWPGMMEAWTVHRCRDHLWAFHLSAGSLGGRETAVWGRKGRRRRGRGGWGRASSQGWRLEEKHWREEKR